MPEFPDWLRGLALIGYDGSDYVVISAKSTGELYTLIQGEYAGTPATIAVDADGNMLVVLKGQFGGELVTVKLDEEGRLYSYVTDDIDQWGNILPGGFAEMAARLGSVQSYERRGQVVFTDSFESGLGGWEFTGHAAATKEIDPTVFIHGGYSVHLKSVIDVTDYIRIGRIFGGFPADVGIGAAWWAQFTTVGQGFEFGVNVGDGSVGHSGQVKGLVSDSKLYYLNSVLGWTEFGTWDPSPVRSDYFRFFKVAIDLDTSKYLYAVVDGTQYDLSANACYTAGYASKDYYGWFEITSSDSEEAEAYVDSFVLTTKESAEHI